MIGIGKDFHILYILQTATILKLLHRFFQLQTHFKVFAQTSESKIILKLIEVVGHYPVTHAKTKFYLVRSKKTPNLFGSFGKLIGFLIYKTTSWYHPTRTQKWKYLYLFPNQSNQFIHMRDSNETNSTPEKPVSKILHPFSIILHYIKLFESQ